MRPKLHIDEQFYPPDNVLRCCVSGKIFDIPRELIAHYPDALLASPDVEQFYNPSLRCYFFDRSRLAFEYIARFYQIEPGTFVLFPEEIPAVVIQMELDYFRIGWRYVLGTMDEISPPTIYRNKTERAFAFFSDPDYSKWAKIYMWIDLIFICTSIVQFIVETEPIIWDLGEKYWEIEVFWRVLMWMQTIFFTIDFTVRLAVDLNKLNFLLNVTNWLDFVAILPFYVDIISIYFPDAEVDQFRAVHVLAIARVARCFKILKRSEKLSLIVDILASCSAELSLFLFAWVVYVLMSGSLLYYAENPLLNLLWPNASYQMIDTAVVVNGTSTTVPVPTEWFHSILQSCWWAVITISTTGYGEVYPVYAPGKMLSAVIIFCSSVFMAIPMTIIIKKFSEMFEKKADEERLRKVFKGRVRADNSIEHWVEIRQLSDRTEQTKAAIKEFREGTGRSCSKYAHRVLRRLEGLFYFGQNMCPC